MARRRQCREWVLQALYQHDFNPGAEGWGWRAFWEGKEAKPDDVRFTEEVVAGVVEHQAGIDATIRKYAEHWDLERMSAVDRSILRMAIYEMQFRPDIPPVVSIDEAVDIAKAYGDVASGKFVNGMLDRIRKDLDRPSRTPREAPA